MLSIPEKELQRKALRSLLFLLFHSFPKVRKVTAEKLYTGLITMEDPCAIVGEGNEERFEEVTELISQIEWNDNLKIIGCRKEEIYNLFGMEIAKVKKEEVKKQDEEMKESDGMVQIKT